MGNFHKIIALSEYAVSVNFGDQINEENRQKVERLNYLIHKFPFPGFINSIPAYTSLTLIYDPLKVLTLKPLQFNQELALRIDYYLNELWEKDFIQEEIKPITKIIPVHYGLPWGKDLDFLSNYLSLDPFDIVQIHSEKLYKVYMMGFIPGFPYLGGMDKRLECPRKLVPQSQVLPGSVGIAGIQTGIYPLQSPGGWQIIGRTPLKLFDPFRVPVSWLNTGDSVKFQAISAGEFEALAIENP